MLQTREQQNATIKEQTDALLSFAGGASHLARMLGVPEATAQSWSRRGKVSPTGALAVGNHLTLGKEFPRHLLRPDLYPNPKEDNTAT